MHIIHLSLVILITFASYLFGENWVIVANGTPLPKSEVIALTSDCKIMALDGAADLLCDYEIFPDVILGDLDSIKNRAFWGVKSSSEDNEPYSGNFNTLIVPALNQDYTDLDKGIQYCLSKGSRSITMIHALGGDRMDHILGNIGLLRKHFRSGIPMFIVDSHTIIEYVKDSEAFITGKVGDKCAIMGYPTAKMNSSGLKYNGTDYPLILGVQESVSNELADSLAWIKIDGEALIIRSR